VDPDGKPISFVFDGLSARSRITSFLPSPRLSSFFILYKDQPYYFNSVWDLIRTRSYYTSTEWTFRLEHNDLSFHGHLRSDLRDFAGLTYEDTDGSLLYCANSKLSDMEILIYRNGKLENSLNANSTAAFEVVSRDKNPYVPLLI